MKKKFIIRSHIYAYPGMAGWHFIGIPKKESNTITKQFGAKKKGWGSLPVTVVLGKSRWQTSIFPDKKSSTYLLPLKAKVRKAEEVYEGDSVRFELTIRI